MAVQRGLRSHAVEIEAYPVSPERARVVRQDIRESTDDVLKLESMRADLVRDAPERWYGMRLGQLFSADGLTELLAELRRVGVDPDLTAVRFISNRRLAHHHLCD